ncbi:MAG: esterase/lipase family protein [Planctomycetia bacterium]
MSASRPREAVVLVHGVWMSGLTMVPLQRRLQRAGYGARILAWRSLRDTPSGGARRLAREVARTRAEVVHLVGHSLGGLVVLHLLEAGQLARVGRSVLLGTPAAGSSVAHVLARHPWTRRLLGRSVERGLLGEGPHHLRGHDIGVVAGALPLGLGHVLGPLPRPHDGTVSVAETHLPGARDRTVLPVSHTGLIFSPLAAGAVVHYLRHGRFA